jgi:hypothetical protein
VPDRDGNPLPPPLGYPGTPLLRQVAQVRYDVSNTDYVRDLCAVATTPIVEVPAAAVDRRTDRLSTLVVADMTDVDAASLRRFAARGGNLVLTEGALGLLPRLAGIPRAPCECAPPRRPLKSSDAFVDPRQPRRCKPF